MTPAERVIKKCGGPAAVARVLKIDVSNVHRFKDSKVRGGRGGFVPSHYAQMLLDWSQGEGIDLTPDDFFDKVGEAA